MISFDVYFIDIQYYVDFLKIFYILERRYCIIIWTLGILGNFKLADNMSTSGNLIQNNACTQPKIFQNIIFKHFFIL